ncbi:MAG: beta family protein [Hyphomicrobium sp.]
MKTGELNGVSRLATDVKSKIWPHFIVPPPAERDNEVQRTLISGDGVPNAGRPLARCWPNRPVLVNLEHVFDEFGEAQCGVWLPKAYDLARRAGVIAIPVASLSDLCGPRAPAFKDAIGADAPIGIAIRVTYQEAADRTTGDLLKRGMDALHLGPSECAVLADFTEDVDFTQPTAVSGVIESTIELLQEVGAWHSVAFEGSSYPETNPAEDGGDALVPRNEWLAWAGAVHFDKNTDERLVFGDYAADCSIVGFGKGGGKPTRHFRYATPRYWLVVRGDKEGSHKAVMMDVSQRIVESGQFAGRSFSVADDYIYRTAQGLDGPGSATTWREVNTTHHITRVVRDMGSVKELVFGDTHVGDEDERQTNLFDLV